jgi:hypothetical protein
MKSTVAHWGSSEWRNDIDDLVPAPEHPQAFPSKYPMDLMGRIRVKLCALRVRRRRWRRAKEFVDDLTA